MSGDLLVGFDIGAVCLHCAVLRAEGTGLAVVWTPPGLMHFADITGTLERAWRELTARFDPAAIRATAFTGTGARAFAPAIPAALYVYESVAIPRGVRQADPAAVHVFHIGAKDPYYFHLAAPGGAGLIRDWATGTKCGGGSGTLVEKQCRRLFERDVPVDPGLDGTKRPQQVRLERMFALAETEAGAAGAGDGEFLARCGVVIQSELIHEQNTGTPRPANLARLFMTVARSFRNDVLGGREFTSADAVVATGGVMSNGRIRAHLGAFTGTTVRLCAHHTAVGAIGAAAMAAERGSGFVLDLADLHRAVAVQRGTRPFAPPLAEALALVHEDPAAAATPPVPAGDVIIGIDGGSTTTKGVLIDAASGALLDKVYLKTHGDPERSLREVLRRLARHAAAVTVRGVGITGSARSFYERILLSRARRDALAAAGVVPVDTVPDEITCHALGVKHHHADIDTIFEVGGQDMKFTTFRRVEGVVTDNVDRAEMNYSCQAGSGQTMENLAALIGLDVAGDLQDFALRATRVPVIDATCGVFMEMDINRLVGENLGREEIAAAIVRATAASFYYKFVGGDHHVGRACSAQGGPALGRAFLAALAQVTGRPIHAFAHREVFGAWGAALSARHSFAAAAARGAAAGTAFRGWEVIDTALARTRVRCAERFPDVTCGRRNCVLDRYVIGTDEVLAGGFCPRGNTDTPVRPRTDFVQVYHDLLARHFRRLGVLLGDLDGQAPPAAPTIGIKRSTGTLGPKGIWSAAVLARLGFTPVLSPVSDDEIARIGVNRSPTDFCIARKLATGHAAVLARHPGVRYLYNPCFISHLHEGFKQKKYCIYTESEGYLLNDALGLDPRFQLNPVINFGDLDTVAAAFRDELRRIGRPLSLRRIRAAVRYAESCEAAFTADLARAGDRFLARLDAGTGPGFVGIGRDYVLLDPKASSDTGHMFSRVRGLAYIPQIFLRHRFAHLPIEDLVDKEYWEESDTILRCDLFTADHPRLFPIRMLNFGCGPDSMKLYQEELLFASAGKPLLTFLTDAHTNNAPFVTRVEAHERVVARAAPGGAVDRARVSVRRPASHKDIVDREWLIAYMGDGSSIGAAVLHHFGVDARVIPTCTPEGHDLADRHIHTEVCYPLKGVVSDVLAFLRGQERLHGREFVNRTYLVMIPSAGGPCRFGKYRELLRIFMDEEGFEGVPIEGPSSEYDYCDMNLPGEQSALRHMKLMRLFYWGIFTADLLEDITLRYRPYLRIPAEADQLKVRQLRELEACISQGGAPARITAWAEETVRAFGRLDRRTDARFPLVLYMGEIYMRNHDPYTDHVIRELEAGGLEVVRSPVFEWLHYINAMRLQRLARSARINFRTLHLGRGLRALGGWVAAVVRAWYMDRFEHRIAAPFASALHGRQSASPGPREIIRTLEEGHLFHSNIEGEAPLSIGLGYYFMTGRFKPAPEQDAWVSGLFHVGPFTCMQEGVATAKIDLMIKEMRRQNPDLLVPIVHAFFGDSPNPNLEAEIAVFREQCHQKKAELSARK
ncbi:MAG: acyl-CoA dehydratase activase-related protein [Planctomycetota bacterium]